MMTVPYPAAQRGHFDFGWLRTYHTFSFGQYYDPTRMSFGALRVLNDDTVAAGEGFGTHPHKDMEIISIPLEGVIMHRDSMGHEEGITVGEVQVMSAGTGVTHSEFNGSAMDLLKFLQIWIIPERLGVEPRYDQTHVGVIEPNTIKTIVGPQDAGAPLWINQHAWLSMGRTTANSSVDYHPRRAGNGIFIFVISGALRIGGDDGPHLLGARDGLGVVDVAHLTIDSDTDAQFIVIDVPVV